MKSKYQILFWRDIPAQIKLRGDRQRLNKSLPERFQEAIDEAAMRVRATSTDEYLEEWRASEWYESDQEVELLAESVLEMIEADYPNKRLKSIIANKGYDQIIG